MEFFIFAAWVILSIFSGVLASNKGRSGGGYFLLSMLLTPLVGLLAAAVVPNIRAEKAAAEARREDRVMREQEKERQIEMVRLLAKANSPVPTVAEQLVKLGELREKGILTADEFNTQKARILSA